jgi:broad specificity phosphatase PhoE
VWERHEAFLERHPDRKGLPGLKIPGKDSAMVNEMEKKELEPEFLSATGFFSQYPAWRQSNPDAVLVSINRHGLAISNVMRTTQTSSFPSPLVPQGNAQAEALNELYQKYGIVFDRFLAANLERAFMTLKPTADRQGKKIEKFSALNEVSFYPDELGGMPQAEVDHKMPGLFNHFLDDPEGFPLIGEQRQGLMKLMADIQRGKEKNIAISTHGMTQVLVMLTMLGIPYVKYRQVFSECILDTPNAGIVVAAYYPSKNQWKLLVKPDNSYLNDKLRRSHKELLEMEKSQAYQEFLDEMARRTHEKESAGAEGHGLSDWYPGPDFLTKVGDRQNLKDGGIDIQDIAFTHKVGSAKIQFNNDVLHSALKAGFNGFAPVILDVTPISSPLMFLGFHEDGGSKFSVAFNRSEIGTKVTRCFITCPSCQAIGGLVDDRKARRQLVSGTRDSRLGVSTLAAVAVQSVCGLRRIRT